MTRFKIATDLHIFGPHQFVKPKDLAVDYQTYLLGDIVDMANVKKEDIDKARSMIKHLVTIYNGRYIMGNHELYMLDMMNSVPTPDHIIVQRPGNNIMLCHGHIPLWGKERSYKWMDKKAGAGFLRRSVSWGINKYRDVFGGHVSDKDLRKLHDYAVDNGCRTIITGHKHPKSTEIYTHRNVKIIVLRRGFHNLEV